MIRRPPSTTLSSSSAASDVYTRQVYDTRGFLSWWRGLDFGTHTVFVRAPLRRLRCPQHGVRVQAVPFARHRSGFTCDFEDVAAF
jgi:transposase